MVHSEVSEPSKLSVDQKTEQIDERDQVISAREWLALKSISRGKKHVATEAIELPFLYVRVIRVAPRFCDSIVNKADLGTFNLISIVARDQDVVRLNVQMNVACLVKIFNKVD